MNYGIIGIDFGAVHIGMAWREPTGRISTATVGWGEFPFKVATLRKEGYHIAKVEHVLRAPLSGRARRIMQDLGIVVEGVDPERVVKAARKRGEKRKETARRIAARAGAVVHDGHQRDAVAILIYGENETRSLANPVPAYRK